MKLSFSLSSSKPSSSKPYHNFNNDDDDDHDQNRSTKPNNKEYVTEFDSSKTLTSSNKNILVIPPKPNEWRPHKKMKNLDLPLHEQQPSSQLCFEVESSAPPESAPNDISYGLNLRSNNNNNNDDNNNNNKNFEERPLLPPPPVETVMLEKLKDDLERLPDDLGMDEFVDRPVEGYGAALLAGYGWYEGRGIGRNAKEDVKVVQYERRTNKEGLGFVSDIISTSDKKKDKNGKVEQRSRSSSTGEEKGQFSVGKDVRIIGGSRDVGMKGNIVEVVGRGDSVVLKLLRSDVKVEVRIRNIAELGSVEEETCLRKLKELKIHGGSKHDNDRRSSGRSLEEKRMIDNKHSREWTKDSSSLSRRSLGKVKVKEEDGIQDKRMDNKRSREQGRGSKQRGEPRTASQVSWLTSHIRVRIISKELKGGRLYLKKGEVLDVVGPTSCDICMDDSRELIQGVDQDLLETALPRHGGAVLVLYGKHKGAYGSLVERDVENETGVVRDADTHELLNVQLEQIAEYVGDPSYIGY